MANQYTAFRFVDDTTKECSLCGKIKPHSDFGVDRKNKRGRGLGYYCKSCANKKGRTHHRDYKNNPDFVKNKRSSYFKFKYGLSLEEYTAKLLAQDSKCAICKVELPASGPLTHLDHCHETGKIRAFLCTNCNRGLGHFKDSAEKLQAAIDYLQTHSDSVVVIKEVIN